MTIIQNFNLAMFIAVSCVETYDGMKRGPESAETNEGQKGMQGAVSFLVHCFEV